MNKSGRKGKYSRKITVIYYTNNIIKYIGLYIHKSKVYIYKSSSVYKKLFRRQC